MRWIAILSLCWGCSHTFIDLTEDVEEDVEDSVDAEVEADAAPEVEADVVPEIEAEVEAEVEDDVELEVEVEADVEEVTDEADTYDWDLWFGVFSGPCNCDSDCPNYTRPSDYWRGICYYGICMYAGNGDCDDPLVCPGTRCRPTGWGGLCVPDWHGPGGTPDYAPCPPTGYRDDPASPGSCYPIADGRSGGVCDLRCQEYCWPS